MTFFSDLGVTLITPTAPSTGVLFVCSPGGGFPRTTFDLPHHSMAAHLSALGHTVAMVDLLGTGDSAVDGDAATMAAAGAALAMVTREVAASSGASFVVGLGHSLGAAVTVRAEADQHPFDAVAVLGYSPAWVSVAATPERPTGTDAIRDWTRAQLTDPLWATPEVRFPRSLDDPFSFYPDVRIESRIAAFADEVPVPRALALDFGIPEPALAAAAAVTTPVLLAFGSTDASAAPAREELFYSASPAVCTVQLEGSAHVHHVSSDRLLLWDRLHDWAIAHRTINEKDNQ